MNENELAKIVFDCGLKVHRALGPGLLESAYEKCLYFELWELGIKIEAQKTLPFIILLIPSLNKRVLKFISNPNLQPDIFK